MPLSAAGLDELSRELDTFRRWQEEKARELLDRLAQLGAAEASVRFARAAYVGLKDAQVTAEPTDRGYVIRADGESVLFLEFGSGVTYGGGHPEAKAHGMGPGTYPDGKGHWDDPRGWWLPRAKGGGHSYGNPPAMGMYQARKTVEEELVRIAKEVFG